MTVKNFLRFLLISVIFMIVLGIALNVEGVIAAVIAFPWGFVLGYVVATLIGIICLFIFNRSSKTPIENNEKEETEMTDEDSSNWDSSYGTVNPPLPISHKYER